MSLLIDDSGVNKPGNDIRLSITNSDNFKINHFIAFVLVSIAQAMIPRSNT